MRNVIIVEERFEARGTQRGLALPTAAFADATVRVRGFTGLWGHRPLLPYGRRE